VKASGPALVTGASRGLGRAVAVELARRGFEVLATMRDPGNGASLAGKAAEFPGSIRVAQLDVVRPETIEIPAGLRVLVNNAAIESAYEPLEHTPLAAWRAVFETNVFGLAELTRRALPSLRTAGGAVVCNVTSAARLFPMPFYAVYRASKAAVAALSESLAAEGAEHGIRVVEVMPGPIATDLFAASDREPEAARHEPYRELAAWARRGRQATDAAKTPAEEAARSIAGAILDDGAPLRVACDELGSALLTAADATPHAERMRAALGAMRR